jgi:hypothetical protein
MCVHCLHDGMTALEGKAREVSPWLRQQLPGEMRLARRPWHQAAALVECTAVQTGTRQLQMHLPCWPRCYQEDVGPALEARLIAHLSCR